MAEGEAPSSWLRSADRVRTLVISAVWIGSVLAVTGLVIGLVMALRRREIECPNGTYFPEGTTDGRCFVHPHALDGTAVALTSVMLGILIGLSGLLLALTLDRLELPSHKCEPNSS